MKNLFFLSLVFMLLFSCKDRDEQDTNVLPEATQTGVNTGGALVNGEVWVAKKAYPDLNNGGVNATMYTFSNGEYKLQISLGKFDNYTGEKILINITSLSDIENGNYMLNDSYQNRGAYSHPAEETYFTDSSNTGVLTITKFDKVNKIVSGTFSFKAKNSDGEVVTITDGRFDKQFL